MPKEIVRFGLLVSALTAGLAGCGAEVKPQPVTPQSFYPSAVVGETPLAKNDQPGSLPPTDAQTPPTPPAGNGTSDGISEAVRRAVPSPRDEAAGGATTAPTTTASTEPVFPPGQFMTLGGLVAEVNGVPIFANKVIRLQAVNLRLLAQQYPNDIRKYELAARDRIERQTQDLIRDELELAAAKKTLSKDDVKLADYLTTKWMDRQILEANGSVALARQKSILNGSTFEEDVEDQHRHYLILLYFTKQEKYVQITRQDMYNYYTKHFTTEFSKPDVAQIDLVQLDPRNPSIKLTGDTDDARAADAINQLKEIRKQSLNGRDLLTLASNLGIPALKMQDQRGAFTRKNVDDAIWKLKIGEISDPIQDGDAYYLVKLESLTAGNIQPFDDEKVQGQIYLTLSTEQVSKLRSEEDAEMMKSADLRTDPEMVDTAVEMALQNYPRWAKQ
jgi:hypothetical protein